MPNYNILPITLGITAAEGPKSVPFTIIWNQNPNNPQTVYPISFTTQIQTGQFSSVQAVYVDNSTCPYPVMLVSAETQQIVNVPGFATGMYPIFSGGNPVITVSIGAVGGFTTRLQFFNSRQLPFENPPLTLGFENVTIGLEQQFFNNTGPQIIYTHAFSNRMAISNITIATSINLINPGAFGPSATLYEAVSNNVICEFPVGGQQSAPPQFGTFTFGPPWISARDAGQLALKLSASPPADGSSVAIYINATIGNQIVS